MTTQQPPTISFKFPARLPTDILSDILTRHLRQPPVCAYSLLCPEWSLCDRRGHAALEAVLRTTRVDTYTLPAAAADSNHRESGIMTTTFGHSCKDHIMLPRMRDPRGGLDLDFGHGCGGDRGGCGGDAGTDGGDLPRDLQRELMRRWVGGNVHVVTQREKPADAGPVWGLAGGDETMMMMEMEQEVLGGVVLLREEGAVGMLPFEDDFVCTTGTYGVGGNGEGGEEGGEVVYAVDGGEKDRFPPLFGTGEGDGDGEGEDGGPRYLYQRIRHLVVNTVPALAGVEAYDLGMMPSVWTAEASRGMVLLAERLEYERRANLLIRWDALERLETLFMDLRGYSLPEKRFLFPDDIVRLARSLSGKGLKLLMIAGLRSWGNYPGPDPLGMDAVERAAWRPEEGVWVREKVGGGINWWRMFGGAVRPGGRLTLVDKDDDVEYNLLRRRSRHGPALDS